MKWWTMRTVAFLILLVPIWGHAQTSPEVIAKAYETLAEGPVWIHPDMAERIDKGAAEKAIAASPKFPVKLIVVPQLGAKWRENNVEKRGAYAKWLYTQQLKLKNGAVVVGTKRGITAYSTLIPEKRLVQLNNEASKKGSPENLTPAFTTLTALLAKEKITSQPLQARTEVAKNPVKTPATSTGFNPAWLVCPAIGLGAIGWMFLATKRKRLSVAERRAAGYRDRAVNSIAYLDSYIDLLPDPSDKRALQAARDKANVEYEAGVAQVRTAQNPNDFDGANLRFESAVQEAAVGRNVVEAATGGTGAAFAIAPEGYDDIEDERIYQPVKNVCFFCSKPGNGDLTPVTVNVEGQRKTVLVCPDDLAMIKAGRTPDLRGEMRGDRFTPWYGVSGYNPHADYGTRSSLWDTVALASLMNMMTPHHTYVHSNSNWWDTPSSSGSSNHNTDWGSDPSGGGSFTSSPFDMGSFDSGGFSDGGGGFDSGGGFDGGGDSGGGGGDF